MVLQGSEGKKRVNSQQHLALGVTGLSPLGGVWCVVYKPAVRLGKGFEMATVQVKTQAPGVIKVEEV